MLNVVVDNDATCYVLPVLRMTSCFQLMGQVKATLIGRTA